MFSLIKAVESVYSYQKNSGNHHHHHHHHHHHSKPSFSSCSFLRRLNLEETKRRRIRRKENILYIMDRYGMCSKVTYMYINRYLVMYTHDLVNLPVNMLT